MLSLYFMRYGYHVRTAGDGVSALDLLAREEIHLVLLDLMLPRMDGFTVLRRIRDRSSDNRPYVIVVSAGASAKDRNLVLELGANEYMPKPFHLMRLLETLARAEITDNSALGSLIQQQRYQLAWGTTLIVITGTATEEVLDELYQARRAGQSAILILAGRDPADESLRPRAGILGIPVYSISTERDLSRWMQESRRA